MFSSKILLGGSLIFCRKNQSNNHWPALRWVLGHRGARACAPENTLDAFIRAMDLLADGVEFDVSLSKDGIAMVIHDQSVARTTNGQGQVKDLTALELSSFNASKPIAGFRRTFIPTLQQTLEALPDHAIANIELKFSGKFSKDFFIDKVLKDIRDHEQRLRLIISSFDGELLSSLRQRAPKLTISLILSDKDKHWPASLRYLSTISPEALHLSPDLLNPWILWLIRRAGLKVAVWTINDEKTAQKLWSMGVDGIFTDQVEKVVNAIKPNKNIVPKGKLPF